MLTLNSIVSQKSQVIGAEIDGEAVLLGIENGKYYGMREIGSYIWKLIATPIRVDDLCVQLMKTYDVERDMCETDVLSFLNQLHNESLIDIQNADA